MLGFPMLISKMYFCLAFFIATIIRKNTMFISNNRALYYLWLKENLVKYQKISKYYENDRRMEQITNRYFDDDGAKHTHIHI